MAFNFDSNVDRPNGLTAIRHLTGGVLRASGKYTIAPAYATQIFSGDLVKSAGSGATIEKAAATESALGVFAGCNFVDANGNIEYRPYWPAPGSVAAGTEVQALVFDDPDFVFEVQADDTLVAASLGQNFDIVDGGGSAITGRSGVELDVATAGATGQLRSLRFLDNPVNDGAQANARVEVLIAEHELLSRAGV